MHGRTGGGLKWRAFEWLQHTAIRRFDAVVAVSRPQVSYLREQGIAAEKIHLVPNAWAAGTPALSRHEARRALGIADDDPLVGWVGRLSHEKGADVFVQSLAKIRDASPRASVLGDGAELSKLQALARALGVDRQVQWHGTIPDAGRLFPAFDVFVLSSRTEGTPIVLFEAMATGVPIVATRVGGVPDVVSDNEAALVPADDPSALAHAIRSTLENPTLATERAERARRRLWSEFEAAEWLRRYERIYRSIVHV
jgi:glycosyltransferase involved in cell wall biosynthesis